MQRVCVRFALTEEGMRQTWEYGLAHFQFETFPQKVPAGPTQDNTLQPRWCALAHLECDKFPNLLGCERFGRTVGRNLAQCAPMQRCTVARMS